MDVFENRAAWVEYYQRDWLTEYQQTRQLNWATYRRPNNSTQPTGNPQSLREARLLFISSAGAFIPGKQSAFDTEDPLGDYTLRRIPTSIPFNQIAYSHTHYDHAAVNDDPQVLMPLRHLETLRDEGILGNLSASMISFMGYQPDAAQTVDRLLPEILDIAREEQANTALFVPS